MRILLFSGKGGVGKTSLAAATGLQLSKLGAMLTELSDEQAKYVGLPKQGPYKSDHYRY